MDRERIAGVRVLAVALVLAIAVAVILDLAGVKNWPAKVGAAIVAAGGTVLVNVAKEWLTGTLKQRAGLAAERARHIFMPGGKLPRVRDVTDPVSVGVRPAAPRPLTVPRPQARPGDRGDRVPLYVPRDVDDVLRPALAAGGFVLLVGDATAGKTRTAYEAMRAVLPGHLFIAPSDVAGVAAAVAAAAGQRDCVLWLDDLPLFLGPGGLTRKAIAELVGGTGHHRVILATMRATDESHFTAGGEAGADQRLVRTGQDVVGQADHRIFVERLFSARELARTRALAGQDSRLADALGHAGSGGIGEYLAAGPQLYFDWQDAWARGHHPRGAALIAAAVDCRRAGFAGPLPRLLLVELHPAYLEEHGGIRAYPEPLAQAWAWAVTPRESGSAPVRYTDPDHCDVFGYLIDEFGRREGTPAPESTARTALSYAGPGDASMIANTAWRQGRYELAETAIREVYEAVRQTSGAADPEALAVRNNLAVILQAQGKLAEAEAEYRAILAVRRPGAGPAGAQAARRNLAVILQAQGRLTEAEAEYRAILETRGENAGPADPDTLAARNNLAGILQAQGRLAEAEAEYLAVRQARIDTLGADHPDTLITRNNYAVVLKDLGRLDAAGEEFRQVLAARIRVLGPDHPHTQISRDNLASLTRQRPGTSGRAGNQRPGG